MSLHTSVVPATLDALVTAAGTVTGLQTVYDGPWVEKYTSKSYLIVGGDDSDTESAVTGWSMDAASDAVYPLAETFTVNCHLVVWSGDKSFKARRDDAFELLRLFQASLTDGQHYLGGLVNSARINPTTYDQIRKPEGLFASIRFGVACTAFLTT